MPVKHITCFKARFLVWCSPPKRGSTKMSIGVRDLDVDLENKDKVKLRRSRNSLIHTSGNAQHRIKMLVF